MGFEFALSARVLLALVRVEFRAVPIELLEPQSAQKLTHLPDGLLPRPKVDPPKDVLLGLGRNWVTALRAFYGEGVAGPFG